MWDMVYMDVWSLTKLAYRIEGCMLGHVHPNLHGYVSSGSFLAKRPFD